MKFPFTIDDMTVLSKGVDEMNRTTYEVETNGILKTVLYNEINQRKIPREEGDMVSVVFRKNGEQREVKNYDKDGIRPVDFKQARKDFTDSVKAKRLASELYPLESESTRQKPTVILDTPLTSDAVDTKQPKE